MGIEINNVNSGNSNSVNQTSAPSTVSRSESNVKQLETGGSSTRDTVNISDMARQLLSLSKTQESQPVVDAQRVEAARNSLRNGDFNSERVAQKFASLEAQLNEK